MYIINYHNETLPTFIPQCENQPVARIIILVQEAQTSKKGTVTKKMNKVSDTVYGVKQKHFIVY